MVLEGSVESQDLRCLLHLPGCQSSFPWCANLRGDEI
jgi:hypothetical protein